MPKIHGRFSRVFVDGFDLSGDSNSIEFSHATDIAETSGMGAQVRKSFVTGLIDVAVTHNGLFNEDANLIHAVLNSRVGSSVILTAIYGTGALSHGFAGSQAILTSYVPSATIGGAQTVTANYNNTGTASGIEPVTTIFGPASLGTIASASVDDNGTLTASGARAYLQLPVLSSGTMQVKIQDSTTGTSAWSDLITFSAATARTAEGASVSGTVDRYLRTINNVTGTADVHVAIRRL